MDLSTPVAVAELPLRPKDGSPCLELTAEERAEIKELADSLLDASGDVPLENRLDRIALAAHQVPARIRAQLIDFRLTGRPYGGMVLSNLPIDEALVGPTPTDYAVEPDSREADRATALLLLIGSLMGDPVSYLTQQRGRMALDVFPIKGHEYQQLGSSSTTNLEWHNEDAFHPLRADWIMLIGLRNHDHVPTTFAPLQELELDDETRELLFQERFVILPDESHTAAFNSETTGMGEASWVKDAFAKITEMNESPRRTAILSGDKEAPYVRIDPAFMPKDLDPEATKALEAVIAAFDAKLRDVILGPGDLLIVDNMRAVHGRRPFTARYDGTDRWLRRINVLADLRRAAGRRYTAHGRALV